jgi:hypothetical protein
VQVFLLGLEDAKQIRKYSERQLRGYHEQDELDGFKDTQTRLGSDHTKRSVGWGRPLKGVSRKKTPPLRKKKHAVFSLTL